MYVSPENAFGFLCPRVSVFYTEGLESIKTKKQNKNPTPKKMGKES